MSDSDSDSFSSNDSYDVPDSDSGSSNDSCDSSHEQRWRQSTYLRTTCQDPDHFNEDDEYVFPNVNDLPILVSDYLKKDDDKKEIIPCGWTPKVRTLLAGTKDENSSMHSLHGFEDSILRSIVSYFTAEYLSNIKLTLPAKNIGRLFDSTICRFTKRRSDGVFGVYTGAIDLSSSDFVSFASCGNIIFPSPENRNVNMMPFMLGNKKSLPENLQCYYECIEQCPIDKSERGSICYLTVHESFVRAEESQRREGLHIETPGVMSSSSSASFLPGVEHHWGCGTFYSQDVLGGGIYFASNVANTSIVYNALIDKSIPGIVDHHGNCEYLRRFIGPGTKLEAGQLVWMTDRTPHEAVPQEEDGYRQFFRVVTSNVSHWFAQHSTENPLAQLPKDVVVVKGNKFET